MRTFPASLCLMGTMLFCLGAPSAVPGQPVVEEPSIRVVVIIDGSGTFARQRDAAVARTIDLLDAIAATKLRRWEVGADHVTLIALDALPRIIWQGTLRQLKDIEHDRWSARFDARSDFAQCTDVAAAFRLAAAALADGAGLVYKYLFAFTDLIHEPPAASVSACTAPTTPSLPPASFPWDQLSDVSISVFWAPPNQVLAWSRDIDDRALRSPFAIYSVSESDEIPLVAPPRPLVEFSEEDMAADRARYADRARRAATWLAGGVAAAVLLAIVLVVGARLAGRRSRRVMRKPAPPGHVHPTGARRGVPPATRRRRPSGRTPSTGAGSRT